MIDPIELNDFLHREGFQGSFTFTPLSGGANNKVFRVDGSSTPMLLKKYFRHPDDPRDRAATEFSFATFAWEQGVRCLPQPLACDAASQLGLYQFLNGSRVAAEAIDEGLLQQALDFYRALNTPNGRAAAGALPTASEACFDIASHIRCVEQRVARLDNMGSQSSIDREAGRFVESSLLPLWRSVLDTLRRHLMYLGLDAAREIDPADRRLSPSDFGFHNALLDAGVLRFHDFEYSGWDDPAKLVCDFFCQPAIPVPRRFFELFQNDIIKDLSNPKSHAERISLLIPVYQVKWICIMLNDFLPTSDERRRFAGEATNAADRKASQLEKAKLHVREIEARV